MGRKLLLWGGGGGVSQPHLGIPMGSPMGSPHYTTHSPWAAPLYHTLSLIMGQYPVGNHSQIRSCFKLCRYEFLHINIMNSRPGYYLQTKHVTMEQLINPQPTTLHCNTNSPKCIQEHILSNLNDIIMLMSLTTPPTDAGQSLQSEDKSKRITLS